MKTHIETINGKECTVIKKPFDAEWVKGKLTIKQCVQLGYKYHSNIFYAISYKDDYFEGIKDGQAFSHSVLASNFEHTITILPALPKYPAAQDAGLLYQYASEGLFAVINYKTAHEGHWSWGSIGCGESWLKKDELNMSTTHCIDADGNRHDIAIIDNTASGKE